MHSVEAVAAGGLQRAVVKPHPGVTCLSMSLAGMQSLSLTKLLSAGSMCDSVFLNIGFREKAVWPCS
eukprot:m.380676 g.380676  ORF g.380676 m.380676 type:complete len:67 (-) comp20960_c1_seq2:9-209(-)